MSKHADNVAQQTGSNFQEKIPNFFKITIEKLTSRQLQHSFSNTLKIGKRSLRWEKAMHHSGMYAYANTSMGMFFHNFFHFYISNDI